MAGTTEKWETLKDGLEIYTKAWLTNSPPIAQIFFVHGFSDHCNAYGIFPTTVAAQGIEFYSFDQRGWGQTCVRSNQKEKTSRHSGNSGPTSLVLSDISELLGPRLAAHPGIPCYLVGHSMGGGIALTYATRGTHKNALAGTIVWSPMIDFAKESSPGFIKISGLKLGATLLPNKQIVQSLPAEYMSRDPEVVEAFRTDPLCHDTGTLVAYADMITRGQDLRTGHVASKFLADKPVLVLHGSSDKITDHNSSKHFVASLAQVKDKEFKSFDGWYHKLHNEPGEDKVTFANYVAAWIIQRSTGYVSSKL